MNKIGGGYAMYWFKPIEIHSKWLWYLYTRDCGYATKAMLYAMSSICYWSISNLPWWCNIVWKDMIRTTYSNIIFGRRCEDSDSSDFAIRDFAFLKVYILFLFLESIWLFHHTQQSFKGLGFLEYTSKSWVNIRQLVFCYDFKWLDNHQQSKSKGSISFIQRIVKPLKNASIEWVLSSEVKSRGGIVY